MGENKSTINEDYTQFLAAMDLGDDFLEHHGIKGMHWGIRRYQNKDGSLTPAGLARKKRILQDPKKLAKHLNEFSETEINDALKRFETANKLRSATGAETKYQKRERKAAEKAAKKLEKATIKERLKAEKKRQQEQQKLAEDRAEKESKTVRARLATAADIAGSLGKIGAGAATAVKSGKTILDAFSGKEDKDKNKDGKEKNKDSGGKGGSGSGSVNVSNDAKQTVNINMDSILESLKTKTTESKSDDTSQNKDWSSGGTFDLSGHEYWSTKTGKFDQRVYGKHTTMGKAIRSQYGDKVVDSGSTLLDGFVSDLDKSPESKEQWNDLSSLVDKYDNIPWGAIMKNSK